MWKSRSLYVLIIVLFFSSCVKPIPRRPVSHHSESIILESVSLNKKINAEEEDIIMQYIASDSLSIYHNSPNGFWYKYIWKANSDEVLPIIGDELEFEYEIYDFSGHIIYSKQKLGVRKYIVDKEDLESGIQNGLKLMKENEEVVFLFPSFNAFGFSGDNDRVGIKQPLIYKVKLNKINRNNENN